MKYISIFYFIISFFAASSQSATNQGVMQKYWEYRYRLVGDRIDPAYPAWEPGMMLVGAGQGHSLPADWAAPNDSNDGKGGIFCTQSSTIDGQTINSIRPTKSGLLVWSDQLISLGTYIMVLATEWKLLNQNGQNTNQVETELFYALQAVARLDTFGKAMFNAAYGVNISEDMNGYIARDDIPVDFCYKDSTQFGKRFWWVESNDACPSSPGKCDQDIGCWIPVDDNGGPNITPNEPSKDDLQGLLAGLYLLFKIMPPGHTTLSGSPDPSYDAGLFAQEEGMRIINYMRNSKGKNDWEIVNPDQLGCPAAFITKDAVCSGSGAQVYAWPLFMMYRAFEGYSWKDGIYGLGLCARNGADAKTCLDYIAWAVLTDLLNLNGLVNQSMSYNYQNECSNINEDNPHVYGPLAFFNYPLTAALAMIYGPNKTGALGLRHRASLTSIATGFIAFDDAYFYSAIDDRFYMDLMSSYLNGVPPVFTEEQYLCRLTQHPALQFPAGKAPYPNSDRDTWNLDWDIRYQCNLPAHEFYDDPSNYPLYGNQLNYLLAANLVQLVFPQNYYYDLANGDLVTYSNLKERTITNTFPFTFDGNTFGTNSNDPLKLEASYTIVDEGTYNPGSYTDIQAPHYITGTHQHAKVGSHLHVTNGRVDCSDNSLAPTDYIAKSERITPPSDDDDTDDVTGNLFPFSDSTIVSLVNRLGLDSTIAFIKDSMAILYPGIANEAGYVRSTVLADDPQPKVEVYPNPNSGSFTIRFNIANSDDISIEIYDIMGRTVGTVPKSHYVAGLSEINYNGPNLSRGTYFLRAKGTIYNAQAQVVIQ